MTDFRVLWAFLDGAEEYRGPTLEDEFPAAALVAFEAAAVRSQDGFGLLVWRNFGPEWSGRNLFLPAELRDLWRLPKGELVDRLVGYQDGDRWRPGMAGLEPTEGRAFRYRYLQRQSTEDACRWMGVKPGAYYKFASEARRKLRLYLQRIAG